MYSIRLAAGCIATREGHEITLRLLGTTHTGAVAYSGQRASVRTSEADIAHLHQDATGMWHCRHCGDVVCWHAIAAEAMALFLLHDGTQQRIRRRTPLFRGPERPGCLRCGVHVTRPGHFCPDCRDLLREMTHACRESRPLHVCEECCTPGCRTCPALQAAA